MRTKLQHTLVRGTHAAHIIIYLFLCGIPCAAAAAAVEKEEEEEEEEEERPHSWCETADTFSRFRFLQAGRSVGLPLCFSVLCSSRV